MIPCRDLLPVRFLFLLAPLFILSLAIRFDIGSYSYGLSRSTGWLHHHARHRDDRELYILQSIGMQVGRCNGLSTLMAHHCLHFILITHARSSYWSSSSKSYHVTHRTEACTYIYVLLSWLTNTTILLCNSRKNICLDKTINIRLLTIMSKRIIGPLITLSYIKTKGVQLKT